MGPRPRGLWQLVQFFYRMGATSVECRGRLSPLGRQSLIAGNPEAGRQDQGRLHPHWKGVPEAF